jgi:uncharacterized membrane protein
MSRMNAITFLLIRVSHVLLAAIWLGAVVYTAVFVMPAVAESGPAGGQVMGAIARRGLTAFLGVVAGLTIVSGVWLYWRFTGGFDPAVSASTGGMAFGIGGAASADGHWYLHLDRAAGDRRGPDGHRALHLTAT